MSMEKSDGNGQNRESVVPHQSVVNLFFTSFGRRRRARQMVLVGRVPFSIAEKELHTINE